MPHIPRLVLAGLSGGSGKTLVSLGLARAWLEAGHRVAPFKKGPDYIDAAWLGLAAKTHATNLDPFLLPEATLRDLFVEKAASCDLALVEGNRGLFDGGDHTGTFSSSQLARTLGAPLVLVIDATKMTRTVAAIVHGCTTFEPQLNLAGVILNRTAGERHRRILRQSIEHYTDVPVLGALPKLLENPIPERHMGLISNREYGDQEAILASLAATLRGACDMDALLAIARSAPDIVSSGRSPWPDAVRIGHSRPRIGYVLDAALWFYYQENLEALAHAGADLVPVSLLSPEPWPDVHGLYLGGGFPETQAQALADNTTIRSHVLALSRQGLPIYAECGGFMYLCEELHADSAVYPMAGIFPLATTLCARPQGLGYAEAEVTAENPFHPLGNILKGHEFHYSRCLAMSHVTSHMPPFALTMRRGSGMLEGLDGVLSGNTFAAYTHIHALGAPHWAGKFVEAAVGWRDGERGE